jgi:hypothetical protein
VRAYEMAMGKKVKIIVGVVLIIATSAWVYKVNASPKLTAEEKSKILRLINAYYNDMMNKEYGSALKLTDITTSEYDKTILELKSNDYSIKRSLEGTSWIIPHNDRDDVFYDKESIRFFIQTGVLITYKTESFEATENVYVRKVGNDFKIAKITTDDRFGYIRGSFVKR